MSDEKPDVRELTLKKLGPGNAEARLTLTDEKLVVEAADDAPLPDWLRGEVPFDDLDLVYVDPAAEREKKGQDEEAEKGPDEEPEEEPLPPGFRIARWVEITNQETQESFPRLATMALDGEHVDLKVAEGFAATFARFAGREKPEEEVVEEPVAEEAAAEEPAEAMPTGAPEAEQVEAPAEEEAPAFAAAEQEPEQDDSPAFAAPDDEQDDTPAFAAPDEDEDDTPAFAPPDEDEDS